MCQRLGGERRAHEGDLGGRSGGKVDSMPTGKPTKQTKT